MCQSSGWQTKPYKIFALKPWRELEPVILSTMNPWGIFFLFCLWTSVKSKSTFDKTGKDIRKIWIRSKFAIEMFYNYYPPTPHPKILISLKINKEGYKNQGALLINMRLPLSKNLFALRRGRRGEGAGDENCFLGNTPCSSSSIRLPGQVLKLCEARMFFKITLWSNL